ncbi:probable basic-leucine zipper transcription factor Q [Limulus polyphemus]|uniref:Probable basic-leucine zipper transcription factor Q n=1 Tax=Limulus polyphemus TaxID=6850 RepID=A0ABM1SWJ5_LIMPO|nr:probable basic-leucine zipper transcription factor Q [Limulus polyphemus]XP_022248002.1 probable basic-leucine zipper transcription factor Q [Limulus polyphemus]XP_022248003.1 probable basic-leucine zipper transcription factor Q [Limulus polyphemus]XP_022248004.1 probable basic-leucine zipper transcription factor Q [Limulus polyphemus]
MKTVVFLVGLVVSVAGQSYVYVNEKQRDIKYNPSSNLFDLSSYVYKPPSEVHQHIAARGSTLNAKTPSLTGPQVSQSHQPPQILPVKYSGRTLIETSPDITGLPSAITAGGGYSLEELYASLEKRPDEYQKKQAERLPNFLPPTQSHFHEQPQVTNRQARFTQSQQQAKAYPQQYTSNQYRTTQYAQLQPQYNVNPEQYTSNQYKQNQPYQHQQKSNIYTQQYTSNQYKQNQPYQLQPQSNINPEQYTSNQYKQNQPYQHQQQPNIYPKQYTSGQYKQNQPVHHQQQPNINPQQYNSNQYKHNQFGQHQQQPNFNPQQYTSNQYKQNQSYQHQQQSNIHPQQYTSNQYKQNQPEQHQQQPNIYPQQYTRNQYTQTHSQSQQRTYNNEDYKRTPNFISQGRLQSSILQTSQDLPQPSSHDNYPTSAISSDQLQFFGLPAFILNGKEDKSLEELYAEFESMDLEAEKQQHKVKQIRPQIRGGQQTEYPQVSRKEPDAEQNHYTPQNSPRGNEQISYTSVFQDQFQDTAKGNSSPISPQSTKRQGQSQRRRRIRQKRRKIHEKHNTAEEPEDVSRLMVPIPVKPLKDNSQHSSEVSRNYVDLSVDSLPQDPDGDGIPGEAGVNYPTLNSVPQTSFSCRQQPLNGYYADLETSCQVMHLCQAGGVQDSFLCPNGTIFNQEIFSCQWWYKVDCAKSVSFYNLNEALYKVPKPAKE